MFKRIEIMLIAAHALAMPLAAVAQDAVTGPIAESWAFPILDGIAA